jgi:hypothetical protein
MHEKNDGVVNLDEMEDGEETEAGAGVSESGLQEDAGADDESAANKQSGYTPSDQSGRVWFENNVMDGAEVRADDSSDIEDVTPQSAAASAAESPNMSSRAGSSG